MVYASNPAEEILSQGDSSDFGRDVLKITAKKGLEKLSDGALAVVVILTAPVTIPILFGALYVAALYERRDADHPVVKFLDAMYEGYERVINDYKKQWGVSKANIEAADRRRREERANFARCYDGAK